MRQLKVEPLSAREVVSSLAAVRAELMTRHRPADLVVHALRVAEVFIANRHREFDFIYRNVEGVEDLSKLP